MRLVLYLPTDIIFEISKKCYFHETFPLNEVSSYFSTLSLFLLWSTKREALLVAENSKFVSTFQ
jgi:hypothetical protein